MGRKGTMVEKDIDSQYLDETLTLKIFKPENYSPLYKYHICIMQDGNDYYQLGRVATVSDRLHEEGEIENTIFVGIHYQDRYDRWDKYHPDGERNKAYIKFLVFEVVPLLDKELPSYHVGSCRVLMGDSLGGTVSLMTALKYPNNFGKVIMQSPYVDEQVIEAIKQSDDVNNMSIYHTIGLDETEVPTTKGDKDDFLSPNRDLNEVLSQRASDYTYKELEGKHTWKQWQKDLPNAIKTIFKN
ncbi:esterase family protein [Filobacillus milosensis]|uniref:Esterase family protein n=1 Tax=Filobacillus milosensis TaxID=94137 RepID=A0A4Y8ILQ2_9BACI|nr:alpha/beta hydrolase-fold protein [Filobacillus milosensis]TFB15061.1 esterase family protein [Filobacillus milosensis]